MVEKKLLNFKDLMVERGKIILDRMSIQTILDLLT